MTEWERNYERVLELRARARRSELITRAHQEFADSIQVGPQPWQRPAAKPMPAFPDPDPRGQWVRREELDVLREERDSFHAEVCWWRLVAGFAVLLRLLTWAVPGR